MNVTGRRWTRPKPVHPEWCDTVRCRALSVHGEHRSDPIRRHVPGFGVVVATLTQSPTGPVHLDLVLAAPLPSGTGDSRDVLFAERLVNEIAHTITRVDVLTRAEATPSGTRPARAIAQ